jgi:hypothetical protein
MRVFEEIAELEKQIRAALGKASKELDAAIGENPEVVQRFSPNCFVVISSTVFKHDVWSAEFYDFRRQARILSTAFKCVNPRHIETYLRHVVEKGQLPLSPKIRDGDEILYDGG